MGQIVLEKVTKSYGNVKVVEETSLEIRDKEFLVLVGPSGCGKTTTLRMIAGLEEVSSGNIYIDDKVVNDMPPKDRDIAMVFQNYALYPNMNVYENMAFGLKMRHIPKPEIDERVKSVAKMLDLEELLKRKPSQLSGGQRQRVAVGRAVVRRPKVFLMDEPLSNLDAKLRVHMRAELIMLHQKLQTTIVYVTHDQVEAMTMGDRLVVLNKGRIQQVNTPMYLYNKPANLFVAGFIGSPAMNFINSELVKRDDDYLLTNINFSLILPAEKITEKIKKYLNKSVMMGIRPEHIYDVEFSEKYTGNPKNVAVAKVGIVEPLGSETLVSIIFSEKMITAKVDSRTKAKAGSSINLYLNADEVHIFDPETEENISLV